MAAAEERERSAEEQERERCVAGERAMHLVVVGSKFVYQDEQLEVKTKDASGNKHNRRTSASTLSSLKCKCK